MHTVRLAALLIASAPALLHGQQRELACADARPHAATNGCAAADTAAAAVIQATERLFAAMLERDTAALRLLLHPRAQVVAVTANGVRVQGAEEWIRGLARVPEELRERMWDAEVRIDSDGNLATLWAPYDFHLGERFSHCGMDAFQFVRDDGAWRMIAVTFTRRTAGCEEAAP